MVSGDTVVGKVFVLRVSVFWILFVVEGILDMYGTVRFGILLGFLLLERGTVDLRSKLCVVPGVRAELRERVFLYVFSWLSLGVVVFV